MAGNVGKYISVTKGPKAVSIPRKTRRNNFEFFFAIVHFYFAAKLENLIRSFYFFYSTKVFIIGIKYFQKWLK